MGEGLHCSNMEATMHMETILAGPNQEKRFNAAMDRMAAVGGFVATGSMTKDGWAIYRPQRLAADLGPGMFAGDVIGRYLGQTPGDCEIADMTLAQYVQTVMLSDRCEWCAWPERTGFRSEEDQCTPKCEHVKCSAGRMRYLAHCEYCTVLQMELSGELSPVRISEFA
jgi:hypothetical protein